MRQYRVPRFMALCAVVALLSGPASAGEESAKPAPDKPAVAEEAKAKAAENKTAEAAPAEVKPTEVKPTEAKPTEVKDAAVPAREPATTETQAKADPAKEASVKEVAASPAVVKAQGRLALNMLKQLSGNKKGSPHTVVVSPSSLAGALSVVELGASDELKTSIRRVLGFEESPTTWVEINSLRRITSHAPDGAPYKIASSVVIDEGAKPAPAVIDEINSTGIEAKVRPFSKPETLAELNAWVESKTNKAIPAVIDKLPDEGGLVTLNALYFKDNWKRKFERSRTRTMPFNQVGGKHVDVQMMKSAEGTFSFHSGEKFIAVELPYETDGYAIALVTTKEKPASVEEFGEAADLLTGKGYTVDVGDVRLPRLDLSGNNNLRSTIVELMHGKGANVTVSRFTPKPVQLASAQQRVVLKLDEEGTEAAAATVVSTKRDAVGRVLHFTADKPFVFALRDTKTGLILVAGYVGQPT